MPELRWILIVFGLVLLIGIYMWGRRGQKAAAGADDEALAPPPEPAFDPAPDYEEFDRPLVTPIEDVEVESVAESSSEPIIEPRTVAPDRSAVAPRVSAVKESDEPTLEVHVQRERPVRDTRVRIEPTFGDESVTAELPASERDSIVTPLAEVSPPPPRPKIKLQPEAAIEVEQRSEAKPEPAEAPTIGMSNTPAPRRIERRKIIALRLAAGAQKINGAQLKAVLEAEALEHGKYDVFHRQDPTGVAVFSVASMVEPGTFDLEKMPQETFPGITLFAQLPGPVAGMLAFNELIACSRRLHAALGGTLQDERGVPLTVHRIERIRQEIREFEHRPLADAQRTSSFSPAP